VIVITGTSGAGKGSLERPLMEQVPQLELAVSATTRARREGEVDGVHYHFVTPERFEQLVQDDAFLEHVTHPWGQRVGTLLREIDRIHAKGNVPLLDMEPRGASLVERRVPGAVTIFVKAPSFAELERRLRLRATESEGEIEERLEEARRQLELEGEFDYVIVNDDLERAGGELLGIVQRELEAAATMSST
jgi:guanylate kinase